MWASVIVNFMKWNLEVPHKFSPETVTQRQPALEIAAAKWVGSL
jgi:hypothetical protein